jgi:hypothetical protein
VYVCVCTTIFINKGDESPHEVRKVFQPDWCDSTVCIAEYLLAAHTAAQTINTE